MKQVGEEQETHGPDTVYDFNNLGLSDLGGMHLDKKESESVPCQMGLTVLPGLWKKMFSFLL